MHEINIQIKSQEVPFQDFKISQSFSKNWEPQEFHVCDFITSRFDTNQQDCGINYSRNIRNIQLRLVQILVLVLVYLYTLREEETRQPECPGLVFAEVLWFVVWRWGRGSVGLLFGGHQSGFDKFLHISADQPCPRGKEFHPHHEVMGPGSQLLTWLVGCILWKGKKYHKHINLQRRCFTCTCTYKGIACAWTNICVHRQV